MLPAVAQGAIGIECRTDDAAMLARLARINHAPTLTAVQAERAFLAVLDGSCRTPIAALAEIAGAQCRLRGLVASPDGRRVERVALEGPAADPVALGRSAGQELCRRLPAGFLDP